MNITLHFAKPRPIFALTLLAALTVFAAGCKKHSPEDGHSHSDKPKASADSHDHGDGHDHGHAEGEAEHEDEVKITQDAVDRYGIKTEPAQLWTLRPTVVTPARVAFNTEAMAHVGSPLRGRVVEIKVRLGDSVRTGQDLLLIESPELGEAQADLFQKRSAAQTAIPAVELARMAWERGKAILEQSQGITLTEVQKREAEYKAAVATQKSAEASLIAAENRLHLLGMKQSEIDRVVASGEVNPRHYVKAAIDGVVVQREVTLGELVSPDRESLMILADTRTLWVLAEVPESKLPGLLVGNKAWVTLGSQTMAGPDDSKAPMFEGVVAFIAPLVDPTTRTAQVRIEVPADVSGTQTLKPGMFAQAELVLSTGSSEPAPQVAVPDSSIQTVEGGPAIFVPVKNEPNTFAKRPVTVGAPVGGLVPVFTGLVEGEQYVVSGTFILKAELGKSSAAHEH